MSSDVRVPVLSKQHMSTYRNFQLVNKAIIERIPLACKKLCKVLVLTFPANGILNGSVQKIPRFASAIKEVLTAIDSSIGSSGGITEVIINEQLKKSLYLLLVGSSNP